jgi:diketogulonate reductase-like aldo/keto reductase
MNRRFLGHTGVQVPEVGLGTAGYHAGTEPLRRGLDAGALFIDTAEAYGSEPVVAEAIRGLRDQVFLATKVSPEHFRRAELLRAADQSLQKLRTDRIDLYQLHKPNPNLPIEETMAAMEELVDAGKVRFIGVSNFSVPELERAQKAMRKYPIVANQVRYNVADRTIEPELLPFCESNGITVIAYSPLASVPQRLVDCDPRGVLRDIAAMIGKTPAQVALNWCLSKEPVVVIPKGSSITHVIENCGASGWRLSAEHLARLNTEIVSRRRGRFETLLRNRLPRGFIQGVRRVAHWLPRGLRRRLS